jgi:CelD/BcsL family acetyltransferase involved in cellulose biosynthesis
MSSPARVTGTPHRVDDPLWSVETLRHDSALAELAGEWEDLYARCSTATPFACHAWLDSWWRSYGRRGRLVLIVVRRRGQLVAALALHRSLRAGLPVLAPLGESVSDFLDVLVDDAHAEPALVHLTEELSRHARTRAVDLIDVAPDAAIWRTLETWPHRHWRLPGTPCLELPVRPIAEVLAGLPGSRARQRRRKQRRIEAAGITVRWVTAVEASDAVHRLLAIHREQWRGRAMSAEHRRRRFARHLSHATTMMIEHDQAAIAQYWLDGHVLGVDLVLIGHRMLGAYLYGIHPDLRRRVDVTQLLLSENLELGLRLGLERLSFMRGDEEHKWTWQPTAVPNERLLLAGGPAIAYAELLRRLHLFRIAVRQRMPALRTAARWVKSWRPSFM